ncbi:MAG: c-type cytochrome [Pirellulaceae bacterium]|nr:c-type cytochrome [Pirellulaceae bacterium]
MADDDDELQPGLVAVYRDAAGREARRIDAEVNLHWSRSDVPDGRLSQGPYQAEWTGLLLTQSRGSYRLSAFVEGELSVRLAGKPVLEASTKQPQWVRSEPIDLSFGWHPLEVRFGQTDPQARLSLYWSGPDFQLEPIGWRQLFHEPAAAAGDEFRRGQILVRALRCAACHELPGERLLPAPALDQLAGNLEPQWLVDWLAESHRPADGLAESLERRMPRFEFSRQQAEALAAYLLHREVGPNTETSPVDSVEPAKATGQARPNGQSKKSKSEPPADPAEGRRLLLTIGCLACHQLDSLGSKSLLGGGDLTAIAAKRPAGYFARWLTQPLSVNRQHRMPQFDLTPDEQRHLAAFLSTCSPARSLPAGRESEAQSSAPAAGAEAREDSPELVATGQRLFVQFRCHACHQGPAGTMAAETERRPWSANFAEPLSCLAKPSADSAATRPRYVLDDASRRDVVRYWSEVQPRSAESADAISTDADWLLREKNCLACHARGVAQGLAAGLTRLGRQVPDLGPLAPALTPPSLEAVGDKLHDSALRESITRQAPPHRPWLLVRMPRFRLDEAQLESLVEHLVVADRVPDHDQQAIPAENSLEVQTAGARLVTTDGFGCTSCHRVGGVEPPQAPLNAKGPDLSGLGRRIRYPWFDRWVRNPARIVPRMEMPSVKLPVRGVLDEQLDRQLATVWHVLNQPGYVPPLPNPVRVVRRTGVEPHEPAAVITDVVQAGGEPWIKPLLIGLPNRHNILFDLATAQPAIWTLGDVARQRTQGKTWFWELAGVRVWEANRKEVPWSLHDGGRRLQPKRAGQFVTEFDAYRHLPGALEFEYRLQFGDRGAAGETPAPNVRITETYSVPPADAAGQGFERTISVHGLADSQSLHLQLLGPSRLDADPSASDGWLRLAGPSGVAVRIAPGGSATLEPSGRLVMNGRHDGPMQARLQYRTQLPVDQFPPLPESPVVESAQTLDVVPGFQAVRLPVSDQVMPTALAWRPDGTLAFTSLKGRVWIARDSDGDGLEDQLHCFSDDLAAPFGLAAGEGYLDVINKYALLRLYDDNQDGRADRVRTVASGWGHTADYHDWATGLPATGDGGYYIATACQQDQRDAAAAHWRGMVLRLDPRQPTADDPRAFQVQPVSGGHRFPIGIARRQGGELFVTDNQGNYNPFNELNHVRPGARYGFLNAIERRPGFEPPLTPPAVNIPHPWTRSVNGICFLETPPGIRQRLGHDAFGPFEGHLVGCEYDTRRLIRISLQRVGNSWQGAAYPFSYDQPPQGQPLLGPLACAVSPQGDLYVGCLRDSGWGGANNVGSLVRLRPDLSQLPAGLAEVTATSDGFLLRMTRPVDPAQAARRENFSVASYTRVATPAYGGPDQERRNERLARIEISDDRFQVRLVLDELRAGFVYEFRVKNLAGADRPLFPDEAHYTLNVVP